MASENETVMDVCAEWRDCLEAADPSVWNDERIAELVKTTKAQQIAYLARIEAAWKRERAEIEANALAVGGIVEAAQHKPCGTQTTEKSSAVGNAAAMREALITIRQQLQSLDTYGGIAIEAYLTIVGWIDAALSAPARNCDIYKTPDDCMRAFESYVREHGELGFINPFTEVVKWLFAPAAERKGEGDGQEV